MNRYIIKQQDVGRRDNFPIKVECEHCRHTHTEYLFEPLGRVLKQDVGKICKRLKGIWYVENQEQFEKRVNK